MVIDGKRKLKPEQITEFKNSLSDDGIVNVLFDATGTIVDCKKNTLIDIFKNEELEKLIQSDDEVITFIGADIALEILGIDFRWWIAPVRNTKYARLKKLFSLETPVQRTKRETEQVIVNVQIGKRKEDGTIEPIDFFNGPKRDAISFINKHYAINELRTFFDNSTMITINDSGWKTMQELIDGGIFEQ